MVETRDDKTYTEMEELRSNKKLRAMTEGDFVQKIVSGRHLRKGGARRHGSKGKYLDNYVIVVRQYWTMNGVLVKCHQSGQVFP